MAKGVDGVGLDAFLSSGKDNGDFMSQFLQFLNGDKAGKGGGTGKDTDGDGMISAKEMADTDGDGKVSTKEMKKFADKDGDGQVSQQEALDAFDMNGDGNLTMEDIMKFMEGEAKEGGGAKGAGKGKGSKAPGKREPQKGGGDSRADEGPGRQGGKEDARSFDEMDRDGDGMISAKEMADTDGDGKISAEEMKAFADKNGDGQVSHQEALEAFDMNGDGNLGMDDLMSFMNGDAKAAGAEPVAAADDKQQ